MFYFATGNVVIGLAYNLYASIKNFRAGGVFWNNQNLIVDNQIKWKHLLLWLIFAAEGLCNITLSYITFYYSIRSGVNSGVITVIWRLTVLLSAVADYFMYGIKLRYYHIVGLASIFLSCIAISFAG